MNKKGFVFIESVLVLVVVALSISMLMSSYSLVSRKTKEKEYYNKASDKYLLYSLSTMGVTDTCNYAVGCEELNHQGISLRADAEGSTYLCTNTKVGEMMYDCVKVFKDMNIKHLYVVENIRNELNDLKVDGTPKGASDPKAIDLYDNGTIEYMKTLKKCNDNNLLNNGNYINFNKENNICNNPIKYMIGVFVRGNNDYYYASIELTNPIQSNRNGWELVGDRYPVVNQKWVYYQNGELLKGLHILPFSFNDQNLQLYYLDPNSGVMLTGWRVINGKKYCFLSTDPDENDVLNGYAIKSSKIMIDGVQYEFDSSGDCISSNCSSASGVPTSIDWYNQIHTD